MESEVISDPFGILKAVNCWKEIETAVYKIRQSPDTYEILNVHISKTKLLHNEKSKQRRGNDRTHETEEV